MNEVETRKYEMLARVRDFGVRNASAFPAGAFAADLFAQVGTVIDRLSSHSVAQAAGGGAAREGAANRRLARKTLRDDLEAMGRTARIISVRLPNVGEKFRLPITERDQALLDSARAFAADARPLAAEFALHEMSATFFAKLDADIAEFEQSLAEQRGGREARIAATAAIGATLASGLRSVRQLDTVIRNKFAGDSVTLMAWASARRVQRTSRSQRVQPPVAANTGD
jgi:hypothetical protein